MAGDNRIPDVELVVQNRVAMSAVIANGATESNSLDLSNTAILAVIMPAAWTAADLTVHVSADGTRWITAAYDDAGAQCNKITAPAADKAYAVNLAGLLPYRYAKLVSSVAQGAERTISVVTRPLA